MKNDCGRRSQTPSPVRRIESNNVMFFGNNYAHNNTVTQSDRQIMLDSTLDNYCNMSSLLDETSSVVTKSITKL